MNQQQPAYKFYPTLLDAFDDYLNSSRIYNEFWGFAENPSMTEEEFEQKQFDGLIDKINRVPFESEAADKGTAFNEVIDCILENRRSDRMEISSSNEAITVRYKEYVFSFGMALCRSIANRVKDGITQQRVEGMLKTRLGDVLLYGNMDYLMPFKVIDLKTTSKYNAFKFRNKWQTHVYPFCLEQMGNLTEMFEYLVTDFKNIWDEQYRYVREVSEQKLVAHCERFIEFIEQHKHLITDKKIFAKEDESCKDLRTEH